MCDGIRALVAEGEVKGRKTERICIVVKMFRKGRSFTEIAEFLEEPEEKIMHICEVAEKFAPDYDSHKIYELLQEEL
ncbi:MAG: hypothetical protein KH452_11820 [Clostridiales bacterium]|nr:hypothetical protein [Clostridiales bacterium]